MKWNEVKCSTGKEGGGGRVFMEKVYRSTQYTVLSYLGVFTFCTCCILICLVCIVASFKLSCV